MPEGDSVYQLAHRLDFMVGKKVLTTQFRVPRYALMDLSGATVDDLWPYGKHLFMLLGQHIIHTHLKMEGTWAFHRLGTRWRKPGHTARVVIVIEDQPAPIEIVGHNLGLVEVFPAAQYNQRMGYLGPDVLYDDWEEYGRGEAIRRLKAQPHRAIGAALLDQKNLAGVGNEYRAEICFLAGVHPALPVEEVDVPRIVDLTRRLMWANKDSPIRVSTGVKKAGESSYVFGRNGRPCRRCGTAIDKDFLGGPDRGGQVDELERVIWWCPRCQPLPHSEAGTTGWVPQDRQHRR